MHLDVTWRTCEKHRRLYLKIYSICSYLYILYTHKCDHNLIYHVWRCLYLHVFLFIHLLWLNYPHLMLNLTPQNLRCNESTKAKVSLLQTGLEHQHGPAKAKVQNIHRDAFFDLSHVHVSKTRDTPKWMVKIMENPIKMDDFGRKPTIFGNIHVSQILGLRKKPCNSGLAPTFQSNSNLWRESCKSSLTGFPVFRQDSTMMKL